MRTRRSSTVKDADYEPFDSALSMHFSPARDDAKYRALVELGARAGDPLAQYAMATWFLHGDEQLGIKRSVARAVPLLMAAARTFNRAMYDLAICYLNGRGVARDERRAYLLFSKAARHGSITAMFAQAYCLESGVGTKRSESRSRRVERAAEALKAAWPR